MFSLSLESLARQLESYIELPGTQSAAPLEKFHERFKNKKIIGVTTITSSSSRSLFSRSSSISAETRLSKNCLYFKQSDNISLKKGTKKKNTTFVNKFKIHSISLFLIELELFSALLFSNPDFSEKLAR